MKLHLVTTIATLALASSVVAASAAQPYSTMSNSSSHPTAMQSMAKEGVSLTHSQQRLAWSDLSSKGTGQNATANFKPAVGAAIPGGITLKPVPTTLSRRISALKPYDFAVIEHKLLIVNPTDKKVVEVISSGA